MTDRNKGTNLLNFPDNYVAVDLETTGLDPAWNEIIEIGAIRVKNRKEIEKFSMLVQPKMMYKAEDDDQDFAVIDGIKVQFIDDFIRSLTGITNRELGEASKIDKVLPKFMKFVGDSVIVGHNVNFDINFLYDNIYKYFNKEFQNDFIDTMRLGRRLHPELKHHRLKDLADLYKIDYSHAHRALEDCAITNQVLNHLKSDAIDKYGSLEEFDNNIKAKSAHKRHFDVKDIIADPNKADPDNPLYGKSVCITGALQRMLRKDALQLVCNLGGIPTDSVTKKTNFLVLGNNSYNKAVKDGQSSKQRKAEKLMLEGQDIQIISENVFYDMIGDK